MTDLELVRNNIDDHPRNGLTYADGNTTEQVYVLDNKNVYDLVVTVDDVEIDSADYTLSSKTGEVIGIFDGQVVKFKYTYAAFTDAEILYYLEDQTVNKATFDLVSILLMSASKRFDYKSGQKDMKTSQVFEHLRELQKQYETAVANESPTDGVVILKRTNRYYEPSADLGGYDLSRADEL